MMNDKRLETVIGNLLRTGVLVSAALVLAGGIWLLLERGGERADYHQFRPPALELRSPGRVVTGLGHLTPPALIQFGLLVLIATPVARVIVSLVAFALDRDRLYVALTTIVLLVLLYSLAVPHG
jgi:uncharacterized membrane protein